MAFKGNEDNRAERVTEQRQDFSYFGGSVHVSCINHDDTCNTL